MGLMGRRRRVRRRRLAVAGVAAYQVGKHSQPQGADPAYDEGYEDEQAVPPAPPPPAPTVGPADPMDEIERLADLHGSGQLTDEEFSAAKAQVLGL